MKRSALSRRAARAMSAVLLIASLVAAGCQREPRVAVAERGGADGHGAGHDGAHGHGAAVSDLDRPLDELLAAVCEHELAQHRCDACRYELGMVAVDDELLLDGGPLALATAAERPLGRTLDLNGELRLDQERAVEVQARVAGTVRAIMVDVGSRVLAGEPLLVIESADFAEAQAAHLQARAALALAEATVAREADLFARGVCPRKDLLEAEAARAEAEASMLAAHARLAALGLSQAAIDSLTAQSGGARRRPGLLAVPAPRGGVVLAREVGPGAAVEPGRTILLLADTSRLWVLADLYERDLALLEAVPAGAPASVRVAAFPGTSFAARWDRLDGALDPRARVVRARALVDNPEGRLRPGMFARLSVGLPGGDEALTVPADAVLEDEGRLFAFLRLEPPLFVRRPVAVGRTAGGWVEITSGLAAGQQVVAAGAFLLKSDVLRAKMGAGCAD